MPRLVFWCVCVSVRMSHWCPSSIDPLALPAPSRQPYRIVLVLARRLRLYHEGVEWLARMRAAGFEPSKFDAAKFAPLGEEFADDHPRYLRDHQ